MNNIVAEFAAASAGYFCYLFACDKFCKRIFKANKRNEILFISLGFCSATALNAAVLFNPRLFFIFVLLSQAAFIFLIVSLFRGRLAEKLFSAFVLLTVYILTAAISDSLLSALILSLDYNLNYGAEPILNPAENAGITAATYCFIAFCVFLISKRLKSVIPKGNKSLCRAETVPLILIIAVFDFANWGASKGIMVRSGGDAGLYLDQIYSYLSFAALASICALSAAAYIYLTNKAYIEQQRSIQKGAQLAVYKSLAEQLSRTERLRHDMKNHIIGLNGLLKSKQYKKAEAYLKSMEDWAADGAADLTGNKAADALLQQKKKTAEERGINWECCVNIPRRIKADEFDLCVILGNILDNALEACEKIGGEEKRFIQIYSHSVKNNFLLEIKNSVPEKSKHNFKSENARRGFGLKNVSETASRLGGSFVCELNGGVFISTVLVPMHKNSYDD